MIQAYVGNPRSEEKNLNLDFLRAHFMNPCTVNLKESKGFTSGARKGSPDSLNPGGGNESQIRDCPRRDIGRGLIQFLYIYIY